MVDYIPEIDGQLIPKRSNPDQNKNAHADSFITFLKDNRSIILNGRITPEYNDYTFVSTRGCSVPDYFFCPVDNIINCTEMKTVLISDVINDFKMLPPNSLPDHSILSGKFITSYFELGRNFEQQNANTINTSTECSNKPPRKNLTKIDENFLMSRETLELVLATISRLQTTVDTKEEMNRLWTEVKEIFITEMNKLPDIPRSSCKKLNRKFRKSKPFWNQELEQLWSSSCQAEKSYLHFKVKTNLDFPIKKNYICRYCFIIPDKNWAVGTETSQAYSLDYMMTQK